MTLTNQGGTTSPLVPAQGRVGFFITDNMGNRVAAGDEAGDVGFKFGHGSSEYFVYSLVMADDADYMRVKLGLLKERLGLINKEEFKFHHTSERRRREFFSGLVPLHFAVRSLIVYKPALTDECRGMAQSQFYGWFIAGLLAHIPASELENTRLVLDELSDMPKVIRTVRRYIRLNKITTVKRIGARRSSQEVLIQLADMCAGSILREVTTGEVFHEVVRDRFQAWWL